MVALRRTAVVPVRIPFADLSPTKLHPAVVLAAAAVGRGDWMLCQVTSQPYDDARAIKLEDASFATGSLHITSYARRGKLFTVIRSLMIANVDRLRSEPFRQVIDSVVTLLRGAGSQ